ncbi:MAG: PorT family protein [Prevotella sp.]|nr:PorT family protein [Prevotella sp.]MBQ6730269.1 PorT family protein [Bacteroidales bacterium]
MKKLLMMVVALFATLNMNAQGEAGGMFVKPMAGLTYSTITKSDAKMKLGFAAGAEFGYNFTENITFTGGLLYTMEGAKRDYRSGDLKTTLGYLNIPILFNYYVIPGLALKTGIQPGILLSQKTKIEVDNYETENTGTDGLNKVDIAVPFGVSYEFSDFIIDARYNLGLLKIAKDSNSDYEDPSDGKNSFFMLTVGYKINF